jgi:hypothetical protein
MRTSFNLFEGFTRLCSCFLLVSAAAFSQSFSTSGPIAANDLVRVVVANELRTPSANDSRWMYHIEREEQGKKIEKEVIQAAQGSIDRLTSVDGHPLSNKMEVQETNRIQNLINNAAEQRRTEEARKKDAEQCTTFFKMIPEAFNFIYAGTERNLIELSYQPNPGFQPSSREARVLHELEGEIWVDATQRRLVRIRGLLIADVKFAGGLLGYLQKGGHFEVEQQEISPRRWELTSLNVEMQGKALLLKTISVQQKERRTNYRTVPRTLSLAEAAEMLTKQVVVAVNH